MKKYLIIQTAFIGDVILATPLPEKIRKYFPDARIDFLVRHGNESLLENNPHINNIITWEKKKRKLAGLLKITRKIRSTRYDEIINLQRFFSTGLLCFFSGADKITGFNKNPFSFYYSKKVKHLIGDDLHEAARNLKLIEHITDKEFIRPALYPSEANYRSVQSYKNKPYVCIAPASVWYTKQFPAEKWTELISLMKKDIKIYLIGSRDDKLLCDKIIEKSNKKNAVYNLCGKLNLLESAALMSTAVMNYVNDSAPLHIASAVNAPTTAVFCSTVPEFGFGPLADNSRIIEVGYKLECRPCGLHGYRKCPEGHFKCAWDIPVSKMVQDHID